MKEYIIPAIEVVKGSLTTMHVHAIVNPTNSFGHMGGGVGLAIKTLGGESIEEEAIEQAPIQVGEAIFTGAGLLPCQNVIHAPTMHEPVEKTNSDKVKWATTAALEVADKQGFLTIAFPGMGTGVGAVKKPEAAKAMVEAIKEMKYEKVERIILVGKDDEMVDAFNKALKTKK